MNHFILIFPNMVINDLSFTFIQVFWRQWHGHLMRLDKVETADRPLASKGSDTPEPL